MPINKARKKSWAQRHEKKVGHEGSKARTHEHTKARKLFGNTRRHEGTKGTRFSKLRAIWNNLLSEPGVQNDTLQ